jgi:hypothetical protein
MKTKIRDLVCMRSGFFAFSLTSLLECLVFAYKGMIFQAEIAGIACFVGAIIVLILHLYLKRCIRKENQKE